MNESKKVNVELLKMIPQTSEKARVLLESFKVRQRGRQSTSFVRAYQILRSKGISITKPEFKSLCEDLAQAGAGTVVVRGNSIRFDWAWHLKSIAQAALDETFTGNVRQPPRPKVTIPRLNRKSINNPELAAIRDGRHEKVTVRTKNGFEIDVNVDNITESECRGIRALLREMSSG